MKICKDCKIAKEFSEFYKSATTVDKCASYCKVCHNSRNKKQYYDNHEQNRTRMKNYYYDNHESEKEYRRNHYRNNKAIYLANNYLRDKRIKIATPSWLSKEMKIEITNLYKNRQLISEQTGIEHHVDHIVPIMGENVCGLHVPWNLQIITAEENLRKSNNYE